MRKPNPSPALFGALFFMLFGYGQAQAQLRDVITDPTAEPHTRVKHAELPTQHRFLFQLGSGVMTSAFSGGRQNFPAMQAAGLYRLGERVSIGVGYGRASSTAKAYIDAAGVRSFETNLQQHVGARLSGDVVTQHGLSLYGGIQLGVTSTRQTYRHEFPVGLVYESEAVYLASRPNPFYPQASQIGATGFIGLAVRVLPHAFGYVEVGNNLALLSGGFQARF